MNETAIFGILGELTGRGLSVPDDVSVVSMVTSPQVAELATPALTTMTSPGSAIGRIAIEALTRHLDGPGDRASPATAAVRVGDPGIDRRTTKPPTDGG